jgi:hypothetical protein
VNGYTLTSAVIYSFNLLVYFSFRVITKFHTHTKQVTINNKHTLL